MKVLHIIPSISSKRGGPSTAVLCMVKALRKEGIDASILTTSDNTFYQDYSFPMNRWFVIDEVPILMFPVVSSRLKTVSEYLISPSLLCWLFKHIGLYDAIHIHAIFSFTSTTSMIIARIRNIPYIVRTIGQLNTWSLSQSRLKKSVMLSLIERSNLMNALAIHVTSESEMNDVKHVCKHENIICLDLGVDVSDLDLPTERRHKEAIYFVFLSRVHPKKQLDKLLEAFSIVSKDCPKIRWKLFIAGSGDVDYVNLLKRIAVNNGISDSIEWLGHLEGLVKTRLLRSCDWYVLPSVSENFGLSVVEAMANGVPVIISKEVGISDIILHNKAGLIIGNPLSLVEALKFAMQGVSPEMRSAALILARDRFSWKGIGKKLSFFYNTQIKPRDKR